MEALLDTAFTAYVLGSGVAGERGPRARQREGDEVYKKNTPLEFPRRGAGARQCAESKRSGGERWPYFWDTARRPFGNFGCVPTLEKDSSTTFWTCFFKLAHPPNHTNPYGEFAPFGRGRGCPLARGDAYWGISAFFWQFRCDNVIWCNITANTWGQAGRGPPRAGQTLGALRAAPRAWGMTHIFLPRVYVIWKTKSTIIFFM